MTFNKTKYFVDKRQLCLFKFYFCTERRQSENQLQTKHAGCLEIRGFTHKED